jgi:hypothetical protein
MARKNQMGAWRCWFEGSLSLEGLGRRTELSTVAMALTPVRQGGVVKTRKPTAAAFQARFSARSAAGPWSRVTLGRWFCLLLLDQLMTRG